MNLICSSALSIHRENFLWRLASVCCHLNQEWIFVEELLMTIIEEELSVKEEAFIFIPQ
jgi:hypothetical protein